jgi:hypothetical protein
MKNVALSVATLPGTARQGKCAPRASAVRVSTTAKRLFRRDNHAPSERHKSDFEKAVYFPLLIIAFYSKMD